MHCPGRFTEVQQLEAAPDARLFFALWPDVALAETIYQSTHTLVRAQPGRRLLPTQLHLTLAYLGHISTEQLQCMLHVAAALRAEAFTVQLDEVGHFPKPQVLWLGCKAPPQALHNIQRQLVQSLTQHCDYQAEPRDFFPHMTLWRKIKRLEHPASFVPLTWPVKSFVLAASRTLSTGAEYSILREWPLH